LSFDNGICPKGDSRTPDIESIIVF
jgi:hypothetical protein